MSSLQQRKALKDAETFLLLALSNGSSNLFEEDDKQEEEREDLEDLALINYALTIENIRTNRPISGTRDDHFFSTKWYNYSDVEFLQQFRTSRYGFSVLVDLIKDNPVFINKSDPEYIHPTWQLAIALMRLGHYGSRATPTLIAADVGISARAMVDFTNRVIAALVSIAPNWIQWPDEDERECHGQEMRSEGFPGCVGFIDGTTFPLAFKPSMEGDWYFDRNMR
jgi:hypothetical protein